MPCPIRLCPVWPAPTCWACPLRWARFWLDLARYADSDGYEKDRPRPFAFRYRDWVIESINNDLPYDRFVTDQVAGDLDAAAQGRFDPDGIIATSLLSIGAWEWGESDKRKMMTDIVDDQIDVVTVSPIKPSDSAINESLINITGNFLSPNHVNIQRIVVRRRAEATIRRVDIIAGLLE